MNVLTLSVFKKVQSSARQGSATEMRRQSLSARKHVLYEKNVLDSTGGIQNPRDKDAFSNMASMIT